MTLEEILDLRYTNPKRAMAALRDKSVIVPPWGGSKGLQKQYDPTMHPVYDKAIYPDKTREDGSVEKVTRIAFALQQLAVKRMTELVCGIPVKRVYKAENDRQQQAAKWIEAIYQRNRIDAVNVERLNMLYAGCEVITLWYAVQQPNTIYGYNSRLKFRCRNFSPMLGDELYPLFDEYGDLVALSIAYKRKAAGKTVSYFDAYTAERHIKWSTEGGDWAVVEGEDEEISIGKIPGVYIYRPTPIYENTSDIAYELEWAASRNGNYLRTNSQPLLVLFADDEIPFGESGNNDKKDFRSVFQYPVGSKVEYVTWNQAIENLKYYSESLRNMYFTQLQMPDWSYEKMSQQALSGESRKQLFIDSMLKVKDESGRLLEAFDREMNVVKAFAKTSFPIGYEADVDALQVETQITPFQIGDEKETIQNLVTANGGKPIISQRESVEQLGWSEDVDKTMQEIAAESTMDALGGNYE